MGMWVERQAIVQIYLLLAAAQFLMHIV